MNKDSERRGGLWEYLISTCRLPASNLMSWSWLPSASAVGVLGGFFGVGGAWVVTPALNAFGFPMAYAIGTDLAHMFGKSIVATAKHRKMGNVDMKLGFYSIVGSVIGVEIGARNVMWLSDGKTLGAGRAGSPLHLYDPALWLGHLHAL